MDGETLGIQGVKGVNTLRELICEARTFVGMADAGERTTNKYEWSKAILVLVDDINALQKSHATMRLLFEEQKKLADLWASTATALSRFGGTKAIRESIQALARAMDDMEKASVLQRDHYEVQFALFHRLRKQVVRLNEQVKGGTEDGCDAWTA